MKCEKCGIDKIKCIESRPFHEGSMRRRYYECQNCGERVTTYEMSRHDIELVATQRLSPVGWRRI